MSHILDALRKSERERDVGNVARIGVMEGYTVSPARRWDFRIATTLIIVNGLALALLLEGTPLTTAEPPSVPPPLSRDAARLDEKPPGNRLPRQTNEAEASVSRFVSTAAVNHTVDSTYIDIEEVQRLDEERRFQRGALRHSQPGTAADLVVESHWEGPEAGGHSSIDAPPPSQQQRVSTNNTSRSHIAPELEALTESTPVPLLVDMDAEFQQSLPKLSLDVHVHAELEQNRFVLINQQKYRLGDLVPGGAIVEAIRRDGVVLVHQKRRFMLVPNSFR